MINSSYFKDVGEFLAALLRAPRRVGAVAPSGRQLAALITGHIAVEATPVLELGAGTGVFTHALIAHGIPEQELVLVESDARLAQMLRLKFPKARVLCTDAARLAGVRQGSIGAVVSGLPLLAMSTRKVLVIMSAVLVCMRPGAAFYQFTYRRRCPIPRAILQRLGLRARRIGFALGNIPPATVYCLRLRRMSIASSSRNSGPTRLPSSLAPVRGSAIQKYAPAVALLLLLAAAGCGAGSQQAQANCSRGSDQDPPCTAEISPTTAIISRLGQVTLQGKTDNFTDPQARWWVNESLIQDKIDCAFASASQASFDACPFGYVVYNPKQPPYSATYYASTVTGTFHIAFQADPGDGFGPILVMATITVDY